MLNSARNILTFTQSAGFDAYLANLMMRRAVERELEIIGEAARKISDEFKHRHREIRWRSIITQRHVLAHQYGEIRQELIWSVVTVHIPELIAQIEPLVPPLPPLASQ